MSHDVTDNQVSKLNREKDLAYAIYEINNIAYKIRKQMSPGNKIQSELIHSIRSFQAYEFGDLLEKKMRNDEIPIHGTKLADINLYSAATAFFKGGGNCDHFSIISEYFIRSLQNEIEKKTNVQISEIEQAMDNKAPHAFCTLRLTTVKKPITSWIIAVDPWASDKNIEGLTQHVGRYFDDKYAFKVSEYIEFSQNFEVDDCKDFKEASDKLFKRKLPHDASLLFLSHDIDKEIIKKTVDTTKPTDIYPKLYETKSAFNPS
ncbi:MAG: hypothetical protein EP298_09880 [Gammaproteobacteria bacterium]|nr:MAG: hypothetical protein EP298_09880 [Gammaproteobacteria bacterium]UTW41547.1 hypothetical protein KFE69_08495 [bacterium SCSIO 12844]